jgi:hypothetical protein
MKMSKLLLGGNRGASKGHLSPTFEGDSDVICKPWNQGLSNGITEYELWPYNQDLVD